MKKTKWLVLLVFLGILQPETVQAYQTPVDKDVVEISEIVEYFNGEKNEMNYEEGQYYNEYIFDGHIIQMFNGQTIVWLDGEIVPYRTIKVDGVILPQSYHVKNIMNDTRIPAEFFVDHFGYEIEDGMLVYGDEPVEVEETKSKVEKAEETVEEPVIEVDDKEEIQENHTEEDTKIEDTEKEKEEEKKEEEDDNEVIPVEIGKLEFELDLINIPFYKTEDTGLKKSVNGKDVVVYFESNEDIVIKQLGTSNAQTLKNASEGNHSVQLKNEDNNYYTIEVNIVDSRAKGLTSETVLRHIKAINQDIVMQSGGGTIQLMYKNEDTESKNMVLRELENTLSFFGLQQFDLAEEAESFEVNFNLHDSDWSN